MKVSLQTIKALGSYITGDSGKVHYRSGPMLVEFFNQFGFDDTYGRGFPSRWIFTEEKLKELNGTVKLEEVFKKILDPRSFLGTDFDVSEIVNELNSYLKFDGYHLVKRGEFFFVKQLVDGLVDFEPPINGATDVDATFIAEQIEKCQRKIGENDFDGAITNARSMLEAVLLKIEQNVDTTPPKYDGDLVKLYRRIQKHLNLHPKREDIATVLRQVLSGLASVASGLAGLRNKMSDAHPTSYRPAAHHAKLAVNASRTLADFLFETFEYQKNLGTLKILKK